MTFMHGFVFGMLLMAAAAVYAVWDLRRDIARMKRRYKLTPIEVDVDGNGMIRAIDSDGGPVIPGYVVWVGGKRIIRMLVHLPDERIV